jgi:hypothetical protein
MNKITLGLALPEEVAGREILPTCRKSSNIQITFGAGDPC